MCPEDMKYSLFGIKIRIFHVMEPQVVQGPVPSTKLTNGWLGPRTTWTLDCLRSQDIKYCNSYASPKPIFHVLGGSGHKIFQFLWQAQAKILVPPTPSPLSWPFWNSIDVNTSPNLVAPLPVQLFGQRLLIQPFFYREYILAKSYIKNGNC